MDGPGRSLQWAGECLPLQEKQSRWPGLLEELLKVFVGDKRDNELPPGSPGLFPNVIPWLSPKHNRGNPGGGGGKRCHSVGGIPGKWKAAEAARTELEAGSSRFLPVGLCCWKYKGDRSRSTCGFAGGAWERRWT
ncbi:uncharacterized protein ACIQIH_008528 isoform 2-T3 [Cyanocitta cristata]